MLFTPELEPYPVVCSLLILVCRSANMALPLTREEAMAKGSAELKFIFAKNEVEDAIQVRLFEHDITTLNKFSSFFRDEGDLVQVLNAEFHVDAAAGLRQRAQVAAVMCAWKESQTKIRRQAEVEAEMDTREWTKPIPTGDYVILRNVFQDAHGTIEDKVTPAKEYLEKKLQELENGEFRAETLSEVISKDEVDPDVLMPVFDSKGNLSVKKGSSTVPLPSGPEQLRRRLSVMQNAIIMLALKHKGREEIQDVSKELFDRYKDYLLGDYCYGLTSTDLQGNQIMSPPWSLVLSYEQAIRKQACKLMISDRLKMGAALETAWKCPTTKERHFITPLALFAKRSYPASSGAWEPKGYQKGKGKTKGKGKGTTPDGQKICFRFNLGKCSYAKCKFGHFCNKCFKKGHNALNCKQEAKTSQEGS